MKLQLGLIVLLTAVVTACGTPPASLADGAPTSAGASPTPIPLAPPTVNRTAEPADRPLDLPMPAAELARLSGGVVIDGSSTVFPISEEAAVAFRALAPGVELRLGVSGTGGGFAKFCAGELDIAGASRPINEEEAARCAAAGAAFVELPVAYDGLSVVVHPENSWASCMTLDELRRLWEPAAESTLMRWDQLRAGWPTRPIRLYGAGGDSGTYDYFTLAVVGEEGVSRGDYIGSEDDYLLAQDIAADRDGLGFFGYAYYREYADRLRPVAVDAGAGCVAPSVETIASGAYQPLSRPVFIYVRAAALERPEVRAFVQLYITNGADLVTRAGSIPLPARAYELAARRAERVRLGSVFAGGSQLDLSIEQLLALEEEE